MLHVLVVKDPFKGGEVRWYFDVEHEFERAKDLAIVYRIYVADYQDLICDSTEFENWMKGYR